MSYHFSGMSYISQQTGMPRHIFSVLGDMGNISLLQADISLIWVFLLVSQRSMSSDLFGMRCISEQTGMSRHILSLLGDMGSISLVQAEISSSLIQRMGIDVSIESSFLIFPCVLPFVQAVEVCGSKKRSLLEVRRDFFF